MMKTSTVKIALLLGVLMAFLVGTAYADTVSLTIHVIKPDGTLGPSVTIDDQGHVSGDVNPGDQITFFGPGVGVEFSGEIGDSNIFTTTTLGYVQTPANGMETTPKTDLVMNIENANCTGCPITNGNPQLVFTLTDTGASVPQGSALFTATLGTGTDPATSATFNNSTESSVTVQSSVIVGGTAYNAFTSDPTLTQGTYTNATATFNAIGKGTVTVPNSPDTYSIVSTADITFTGSQASAGFAVDATVDGCADPNVNCTGGALVGKNMPEPTSLLLLGSSLLGLGLLRMKYRFTL